MIITPERLRAFAPHARADIIAAFASHQAEIAAAGLTTPLRVQHFMAQIGNESGLLTALEENLNYDAAGLRKTWPSRFATSAMALAYAHQPEKIANNVYGGRMGNDMPGDGWKYRGGGLLQTTGRSNYRAAGHENTPEQLRQPGPALLSALKFWTDHHLNSYADRDDVIGLRRVANGGLIGLDDVRLLLAKAKRVFASDVQGTPTGKVSADPNAIPPPDIEPTPAVKAAVHPGVKAGAGIVVAGGGMAATSPSWTGVYIAIAVIVIGGAIALYFIRKRKETT